ncbi:hypothetical protein FRB94_003832 [Tulasnella sp. JGI-2019a]|nr:hypothetical protein FRB94_003832 [Tulasnella sp. JGI-2019a]KAG9031344.1 hypothetical protein FRB95_002842 [Tulasnella sp. JGI-2019a]
MPSDSTHPMLFIPELVFEFMGYLPQHTVDSDIDAAGLVCKLWRDVSLDAKWKTANLRPLLSMLAPLTDKMGSWAFKWEPRLEDWGRFDEVVCHVRTLRTGSMCRFSEKLYNTLKNRPDNTAFLLHNLRALETSETDITAVSDVLLIVPSTINRLKIVSPWAGNDRNQRNFLKDVPTQFPQLSELVLSRLHGSKKLQETLEVALSQLNALRLVDLSSQRLSPTILIVLGKLPLLEMMRLWITSPPESELPPGAFQKLVELDLSSRFDSTVASLLSTIAAQAHSLVRLSLRHRRDVCHKADLPAVMWAIATQSRLQQLTVTDVVADVLFTDTLQILRPCGALRFLRLEMSVFTLGVIDRDVKELMKHIGSLRRVYIKLMERANSSAGPDICPRQVWIEK